MSKFEEYDGMYIWRRSTACKCESNCVVTTRLPGGWVGVRDSANPDGEFLAFSPQDFEAFLAIFGRSRREP